MGPAAYGKSLVDGVIHDRHLIAIRRSETMAHRKEKAEAEKSIPEMADEVTREEMRQMYRGGKLTAYSRRMSKFLERALPDEGGRVGMESFAQGTCGDQTTGGGEDGRRGKEEGRGACTRRVSPEAEKI